jgi:hypothetical protein
MNPQDQPVDSSQVKGRADDAGTQPVRDDTFVQNPASGDDRLMEIALPADAEDTDLIEKEWVDRAKQIVEHTREDPYEQQRALSQMKADYLKKRYNKDIKISEG